MALRDASASKKTLLREGGEMRNMGGKLGKWPTKVDPPWCLATFSYFGDILPPYVPSSLAWQTEKWHKKNINSADRKHSTTLLRVTMMMIWTSRIWWRWLLMFWFQCRSSPWCVWPVSPNGILIAHLWRRWLPFNGLQYNWLNMYFQWGFDSLFWWERFWFHCK